MAFPLQTTKMLNEERFRNLCKDCFASKSNSLSVLFGKISASYGNEGLIENVSPSEIQILLDIGYIKVEHGYKVESNEVQRMLVIQKEERRSFHRENQKRMKQLVLQTLRETTSIPSGVQVVVSEGEDESVIHAKGCMTQKEKEAYFVQYVQKAMKYENTRILLGELYLYFEKQLKSNMLCSVIINDAEFTADGETFLKESIFVFRRILGLRPSGVELDHSNDSNNSNNSNNSIVFEDRSWSGESIVDNQTINAWISILKKAKVTPGYGNVVETTQKCIHVYPKKKWCFF